MKPVFSEIWATLEADLGRAGGSEVHRRIHPDSVADLWLVVANPGQQRTLRVVVDDASALNTDLPLGIGIETRLRATPNGPALEVALTNHSYADLYDTLIEDVVSAASSASAAQEVASAVASRIRRWQAFLREHAEGLSDARQRGLFGELHVLHILMTTIDIEGSVRAWVGPAARPQDFNFGTAAIEVKTGAGKQPQSVRIASELQLDDAAVDSLFLWHVSVDGREGTGTTLPSIINTIRTLVSGQGASSLFEDRLLTAGYLDLHADRYTTGFTVRAETVYEVAGGFPRLMERDCPDGVGNVHYSIDIGALTPFEVEQSVVASAIVNDDD